MNQQTLPPGTLCPPSHVLVFADVPEFNNVAVGLIGPSFFVCEWASLKYFATYLRPRLEHDRELLDQCLTALSTGGWRGEAADSTALTQGEVDALPAQALRALCNAYVTARVDDGYQAFFRVEAIPAAS